MAQTNQSVFGSPSRFHSSIRPRWSYYTLVQTTPKKNVHLFTDNIVRKVSSGQICPHFLRTCLSSSIVDFLSLQKADPFSSFSIEH